MIHWYHITTKEKIILSVFPDFRTILRKYNWFLCIDLFPKTLPNSHINSNSLPVLSFHFFMYIIISSSDTGSFLLNYSTFNFSFLPFFSWLKLQVKYWLEVVTRGILVSFCVILQHQIWCFCSISGSILLHIKELVSSISSVLKFLYYFCVEFYQMHLLYLLYHVVFLFYSVLQDITWNDFQILNPPKVLGRKPAWLWYVILIFCSIHFAEILLRMPVFVFMKEIVLSFAFLLKHVQVLVSRSWWPSLNWEWSLFFYFQQLCHGGPCRAFLFIHPTKGL